MNKGTAGQSLEPTLFHIYIPLLEADCSAGLADGAEWLLGWYPYSRPIISFAIRTLQSITIFMLIHDLPYLLLSVPSKQD